MTPKFQAQADLCEHAAPRQPQLKMCKMDDAGNMAIPKEVRDKWLSDPVRRYLTVPQVVWLKLFVFWSRLFVKSCLHIVPLRS